MRLSFYSLLLVVLGALIFAACTANDTKPPQARKASFSPSTVSADGIPRITIPELEALLKNNEAVVIDVRNQESFDQEHILGSKLIPEMEIVARANELPTDKVIVTYCSWANEHTSARAVDELKKKKGIENAAALLGGFTEWKRLNKPIGKN